MKHYSRLMLSAVVAGLSLCAWADPVDNSVQCWSITPEEGALEMGAVVDIAFDATMQWANEDAIYGILFSEQGGCCGYYAPGSLCSISESTGDGLCHVLIPFEPEDGGVGCGKWKLVVPEGTLAMTADPSLGNAQISVLYADSQSGGGDGGGDEEENPAITYTITTSDIATATDVTSFPQSFYFLVEPAEAVMTTNPDMMPYFSKNWDVILDCTVEQPDFFAGTGYYQVTLAEPITESDYYDFTIPYGCFTLNGEPGEGFYQGWNVTIGGNAGGDEPTAVTVGIETPELADANEVAEFPTSFTIWVDPIEAVITSDPDMMPYIDQDWNVYSTLTIEPSAAAAGLYTVTLDTPITEPGTYTFVVPYASITYGALANEYFEKSWTVTGGGDQPVVTEVTVGIATPELADANEVAEFPNSFTIWVDPIEAVITSDPDMMPYIDQDWNVYSTLTIEPSAAAAGLYTVTLDTPITEPGTYTFVVPYASITYGALANEYFEKSWTVTGGGEPAAFLDITGINPESGSTLTLGDFSEVRLIVSASNLELNTELASAATLVKDGDSTPRSVELSVNPLMEGSIYVGMAMFSIDEAGNYTLNLPEGVFVNPDNNAVNEALTLNYTVEEASGADEITLVSIVPDNGSAILGFFDPTIEGNEGKPDGLTLKLTNDEALNEITFTVVNADTDEWILGGFTSTRDAEGQWVWTPASNYPFYDGSTYVATFQCWNYAVSAALPQAEFEVTWQGLSPVLESNVSDVTVTEIDPAPGSRIDPANNQVNITFSAPVEFVRGYTSVGGQGAAQVAATAVPANADNTQWTVTMSGLNSTETNLILLFTDADGKYVQAGQYSQSFFNYTMSDAGVLPVITGFGIQYQIINGVEVELDPASGSEVEELSTITASYEGLPFRWACLIRCSDIKVYNAEGDEVTYVAEANDEVEVSEGTSYSCTLVLAETITTPGVYTIELPYTAFAIGEEYDTKSYRGQIATYTVSRQDNLATVVADADNQAVEYFNLQGVRVAHPAQGNVYIVRRNGKVAKMVF